MTITAITSASRMTHVDTDGDDESILAIFNAADPGAILVPTRPKLSPPMGRGRHGDEPDSRFFRADVWPGAYARAAEAFRLAHGGGCDEVADFSVELSVAGIKGLDMDAAAVWALRAGHVLVKLAGDEYAEDPADYIMGIWRADGGVAPPGFPITDDDDELGLVASAVVWAAGDGRTIRSIVAELFQSDASWPREVLTIFDVELALRMLGYVERDSVWSRP